VIFLEWLWLPAAKLWCRHLSDVGPVRHGWQARANREIRYDLLNAKSGRHAGRWSEVVNDLDSTWSMTARIPGRHARYGWTADEISQMCLRALPRMMAKDW
jgi:hypothetical protein